MRFQNNTISLITINKELKCFFTVCKGGIVKQWTYMNRNMIRLSDLQAVNEDLIYGIACANSGKYLFTVGRLGIIKQLCLYKEEDYIDWEDVLDEIEHISA